LGETPPADVMTDAKGKAMEQAKRLAVFTIDRIGEDFGIHIKTEGGDQFDLMVTYDQLDVIADQIDDALEGEPG
jgi:hypothetical protein